jgi:hypothetical protein
VKGLDLLLLSSNDLVGLLELVLERGDGIDEFGLRIQRGCVSVGYFGWHFVVCRYRSL